MTGPPSGQRLTAREREIANLIGHGLTSKEIAARLKISTRTADAHVQNMLNKLGASSRAQIVALAGDHHATVSAPAPTRAIPLQEPPVQVRPMWLAWARLALMVGGALIVAIILAADEPIGILPAAGVSGNEINDAFRGAGVDNSIWDVNQSDHTYVFEDNGHLGAYIATNAPSLFNAGVSTVCVASGDFDAQVSFELITWPKHDGIWVSLIGSGTPFNTYRTNAWNPDVYGAYLPPAGRTVRAAGQKGRLRLSRVGTKWSGYYLGDKGWSWIASGDGPTGDLGLSLLLFNGDVAAFGGHEALVYFRDFHLRAGRIMCP